MRRAEHVHLAAAVVRIALSIGFLSAVADRFGLWGTPGSPHIAWGSFSRFSSYTGQILWMFPPPVAYAFAWLATITEIVLGIGLMIGYQVRWLAWLSGLLLSTFAMGMLLAFGPKPVLDASVFTAAGGAFLLAAMPLPQNDSHGS